jgi:hypothetical protein
MPRLVADCHEREISTKFQFPLRSSALRPAFSSSSVARWQSGHAAACKAVYAGSIPTLA